MLTDAVKWFRGDPILASKLARMCKEITAARQWRVTGNAYFKQTDGGQALFVGGGSYSGEAYTPAGAYYSGLTDQLKPWLKYNLSTGTITEEIGPPSDPWPANESWRKKADFSGAIYF